MSRANTGKHWGRFEGVRELMAALGEDPAEFNEARDGLYRARHPSILGLHSKVVIPAKLVLAKAGNGNRQVHQGPVCPVLPPAGQGDSL